MKSRFAGLYFSLLRLLSQVLYTGFSAQYGAFTDLQGKALQIRVLVNFLSDSGTRNYGFDSSYDFCY